MSYRILFNWRRCLVVIISIVITSCSPGILKEQHAIHSIEIVQMKFVPAELKVNIGDTVVFINHDFVPHDITEASKTWSSSPIPPGQSWRMEVKEALDYFCSIHPVMKGKILIKDDDLD